MRYFELHEADPVALGIYNPAADKSIRRFTSTRKPVVTLGHLNKLKKIRVRRQKEREEKQKFLPVIYGDHDTADDLGLQQRELEQIKDEIGLEIDAAEVSEKDREHIRLMALNAVTKNSKTQ